MDQINSAEINHIAAALCKAQQEMWIAKKDNENPFFKSKYTDLATVQKILKEFFPKHGLCYVQSIYTNETDNTYVVTKIMHVSGQWVGSSVRLTPSKSDVQSLGAYITYMKRYALSSLAGVICDEEDDDGNSCVELPTKKSVETTTIDEQQLTQLRAMLMVTPDVEEQILKGYKIKALEELPKASHKTIVNRISEIQKNRGIRA